MAVVESLFHLEQIDSEIERADAELASIRRRLQQNSELASLEKELERVQARERAASGEQRRLESELEELEAKITRDQRRMYSGQIVDARELASLEREIEHYRAQRDTLEEQLLEAMEQLEGLQEESTSLTRRSGDLRQRWEADRPALQQQAERLTDTVAGMREERDRTAGSLDPRSLDLYRRLRVASGHAVSTVSNGVCQWCRVQVPPKDVQHARAGALVMCTNCSRILRVAS